MKNFRTLGFAVAALAATVGASSANAQVQSNELEDLQQQYEQSRQNENRGDRGRDGDWRRGDGDWNDADWRRQKPDFQTMQRNCSRLAIQEGWNRNYYSAQYEGGPRLVEGRRGWEMQGRVRLHDRRGYSYVNTICDVRRGGEAVRLDFLR